MIDDIKSEAQSTLLARCRKADIIPGHRYRHYKGGLYLVFAISLDEESLHPLVHYYSLKRKTRWTRKLANFVCTVPPSNEPRFVRIGPATTDVVLLANGLNILVTHEIVATVVLE